jgi:hypothetical protein
MRRTPIDSLPLFAATALAAVLLAPAGPAHARPYATNVCVGKKLAAAGTACRSVLRAWAKWEKAGAPAEGETKREAAIARAGKRLERVWKAAERRAARHGADCRDTTGPSDDLQHLVQSTLASAAVTLAEGTDGTPPAATCRGEILGAAATKCAALLHAEGGNLRTLENDPGAARLAEARTAAHAAFAEARERALAEAGGSCPGDDAIDLIESQVGALVTDAVGGAIVSPNVAGEWTKITPPAKVRYQGEKLRPTCAYGTPYAFFVKRGTVNKLMYYFQGGGACFNAFTCSPSVKPFDDAVTDGDNPAGYTTGFANLDNPDNPFRDWNAVFVSYCTGDIHWGDATVHYDNAGEMYDIHHSGYANARVVEKWAREHFVNPEEVFVTGSSAGAYGAIAGATYLIENVYHGSHFDVVGDAGIGVVTDDFLHNELANWNIAEHLPRWIPALDRPPEELTITDL